MTPNFLWGPSWGEKQEFGAYLVRCYVELTSSTCLTLTWQEDEVGEGGVCGGEISLGSSSFPHHLRGFLDHTAGLVSGAGLNDLPCTLISFSVSSILHVFIGCSIDVCG